MRSRPNGPVHWKDYQPDSMRDLDCDALIDQVRVELSGGEGVGTAQIPYRSLLGSFRSNRARLPKLD